MSSPDGRRPGAPARRLLPLLLAASGALAGCGGMADDLFPSGEDRSASACGAEGPGVCQVAPDFSIADTTGAEVGLRARVSGRRGAVLYFTMWCDDCLVHMQALRDQAFAAYPEVAYLALDYVSGSVEGAAAMERSMGFEGAGFTVLADVGEVWTSYFHASMAVVIVGGDGVIRYNGPFLWDRIQPVLEDLPAVAP